MFQGINCVDGELASKITRKAFQQGVIIETSGADDQVIKFLCPLIISDDNLKRGIDIVEDAIKSVCANESEMPEDTCYFDDVYREAS